MWIYPRRMPHDRHYLTRLDSPGNFVEDGAITKRVRYIREVERCRDMICHELRSFVFRQPNFAEVTTAARSTDVPKDCDSQDNNQTCTSRAQGNPFGVIGFGNGMEPRNLRVMQAFSTCALEGDVCIAEDIVDKIVHSGLLKPASSSSLTTESCRPTDLFCQEVADINTSLLSTEELVRYAFAFDMFTCIDRSVRVVSWSCLRGTCVQRTIKGFLLCGPELKAACCSRVIATECDLWRAVGEHVQDLAVSNVTHLVIAEDGLAARVTSHVCDIFI